MIRCSFIIVFNIPRKMLQDNVPLNLSILSSIIFIYSSNHPNLSWSIFTSMFRWLHANTKLLRKYKNRYLVIRLCSATCSKQAKSVGHACLGSASRGRALVVSNKIELDCLVGQFRSAFNLPLSNPIPVFRSQHVVYPCLLCGPRTILFLLAR